MIYWQLFLAFLQIGAFSFGGGYAAMPLIQQQVITKYGWLSANDFTDLVTISQMTPGPIAVNAATFIGNQVAGIPGALIATIGVVLPSCLFVTLLAFLSLRFRSLSPLQAILQALRPAVVAMIFSAGLFILLPTLFPSLSTAPGLDIRALFLFLAALVLLRKFKRDPILVMLLCGLMELFSRCALLLFKV